MSPSKIFVVINKINYIAFHFLFSCPYETKAWSSYSRNNRRTCLSRWFKEDFKAVKISIATTSSERSILATITTI